jgi:hypothetical protein
MPFQPSLMFMGKARSLPSDRHQPYSKTWKGLSWTLQTFINYRRERFYNIGTRPRGSLIIITNSLAYYNLALVTVVEVFLAYDPE